MQTECLILAIFSKWIIKNNIATFKWVISLFISLKVKFLEIVTTGVEDIYLQKTSVWNPNKEHTDLITLHITYKHRTLYCFN